MCFQNLTSLCVLLGDTIIEYIRLNIVLISQHDESFVYCPAQFQDNLYYHEDFPATLIIKLE